MTKTIESIINEVEKFNESIVDALDSKKISNTREAANSLNVKFGDDFVQSWGVFYLEFLDTGRGPGKPPPYNKIEFWVKTKLGLSEESDIKRAVYFIRKKIADLGTEIYLHNEEGIELTEKVVTLRKQLKQVIPISAKADVIQLLYKFKKEYKFKI